MITFGFYLPESNHCKDQWKRYLRTIATSTNVNNTSSLQNNFTCYYSNDSLPIQIVKIIALAIMLLSSLVGNTLILIIVYRRPELKRTINFFIVNMAVSDLLFPLTTIPFYITETASNSLHWDISGTTGLIMCKLQWYLKTVSITVSTESLVWIAVDRFVAVVFPMKLHLFSSRSRACLIASTWVVALLANTFRFYAFELVKQNEKTICSHFQNLSFSYMTFSKVYTILLQIVPMIAMTILYSAIAVNLRRQDRVYPLYAGLMLYLPPTINPVICISFVQSYRRGLRDIFYSCSRKCCTERSIEVANQEEISLQQDG